MNQNITFSYNYSAKENKEIEEIRKKYLPQCESKLDELKRLDRTVQTSGTAEALCVGTIGTLIFGTGLCLVMQIIGGGAFFAAIGVVLSIIGMIGVAAAYPIHRSVFGKTKAKLTPRILELTEDLSVNKIG